MRDKGKMVLSKMCKMLVQLIGCIVVGTILLMLVYSIPVQPMQNHIYSKIDKFVEEDENPFLVKGYKGSSLDNTTDASMLCEAIYQSDAPFYEAAMKSEKVSDVSGNTLIALKKYLQNKKDIEITAYSRYWHGYLVFLKPLLYFFDYYQIRIINGIIAAFLFLLAMHKMYLKKMRKSMVAFTVAILGLFPMTIPYSLQFSTAYYVGIIGCLIVLYKNEEIERKKNWESFFLLIGVCTSYIDFLTYPVFTLGMPLILCIVLNKDTVYKSVLRIINNSLFWGMGYAGMWAGKWIVSTWITGENVLLNAAEAVQMRTVGDTYGEHINRIMAVLRNLYIYFNLYGFILAALVIGFIGWHFYKNSKVKNIKVTLPLLIVAAMPFLWYLIIANHSYIHYWFTFRALSVSIFAIMMIPEVLKEESAG